MTTFFTCRICGARVADVVTHRAWHKRQDVDLRMDLLQSILEAQQKRIERIEERERTP